MSMMVCPVVLITAELSTNIISSTY